MAQQPDLQGCCLDGVRALFSRLPTRPAESLSDAAGIPPDPGPSALDGTELRRRVEEIVLPEVRALEENLLREFQGAVGRVLKAREVEPAPHPQPGSASSKLRTSSCDATHSADDDGEQANGASDRARRTDKRRWTVMCDGKESLHTMLRGGLHEDLLFSTQGTPSNTSCDNTPRLSFADPRLGEAAKAVRITCDRQSDSDDVDGTAQDTAQASDQELPVSSPAEDSTPKKVSGTSSPHSSLGWRVDALDLGDRLAAFAAAKKGEASVDSIVDLVQSERERWNDERQALEARLDELKERRQLVALQRPDAEKEALKRQLQELREAMRARSRFGAWVCERHMQESDDEEETEQPRYAEKEALRRQMADLQAELRAARIEAGLESDQSPGSFRSMASPRSAIRGARAASTATS